MSKKSGNKKDQNEDEKDEPTIPAASSGALTMVLPTEHMLLQLSSQFNKTSTMHKMRISIFDFYATLFSMLGPNFVETNYALIVRHLIYELVQTLQSFLTQYKKLLVRKLMEVLLRDLIGTHMLYK